MFPTVPMLERAVDEAVRAGDIELALETIQRTVENILYEPSFTARLFSSKALDRLCQAAGREAVGERDPGNVVHSDTDAFIATHVYETGGHTAVLEDFIQHAKGGVKHLILTDATGIGDNRVARRRFAGLDCTLWFAPRGSLTRKLRWLVERLVELAPGRLFLFHHHQDAVAVAAAQPELAAKTFFYHHGDHHLSLGVHLPHAVHIDLHPMGFHNCRSSLGVVDNVYCPVTVKDLGPRPPGFLAGGQILSCTVANRNKIEIPYPYPYWEIVPRFLRLTGGTHLHIGSLSNATVTRIRRGLRDQGLTADRFVVATDIRNVWAEFVARRVDVYLCSFPYGGVRAAVEVMGAGIPVIAHRHYRTPLLGAADATYPGSFRWQAPEELWSIAQRLTADTLAEHSRRARAHFESFHTEAILEEFLSGNGLGSRFGSAPAVESFRPDTLQACLSELQYLRARSWKPFLLRTARRLSRAAFG